MYLLIYTFHSAAKRLFSDNYVFFNGVQVQDPHPISVFIQFLNQQLLCVMAVAQIVACALVELEAL